MFRDNIPVPTIPARACGHAHLNQFNRKDLTTWKKDMADLAGIEYGGMVGRI